LHLALFLIVSIYWGCSAPLTKLLGVPEHLQPPPSYACGVCMCPGRTRNGIRSSDQQPNMKSECDWV